MNVQPPDLKDIAKMTDVHFPEAQLVKVAAKTLAELMSAAANDANSSEVKATSTSTDTGQQIPPTMTTRSPEAKSQQLLICRLRRLTLLHQRILRIKAEQVSHQLRRIVRLRHPKLPLRSLLHMLLGN